MKTPNSSPATGSESLFENAFHHAAIGMALVAPDGAFLKVNRALIEITGYPEEELLGLTFQQITHPEDLEKDEANVEKMLSGKLSTFQMEKRYHRKDGSIVWVLLSASLVRAADGYPLFFISQIQDITDRKEDEEKLSEAMNEIQKLQQGLFKLGARTKGIEVDGRWMSVDDFLREHLGLNLTHGKSSEGARLLDDE